MGKKSGIVATTNRITGTSGKGPFRMGEVKPSGGSKSMHQRGTGSVLANSKGGNVQSALKKIAGDPGMGPFRAREVMTGSKCLSTKHPGLDNATPSRMSSAHGTNGQSKDNNMSKNTGGYRIGAGTRTFKHEAYPTAGPKSSYPRHAGQPSGHGYKSKD